MEFGRDTLAQGSRISRVSLEPRVMLTWLLLLVPYLSAPWLLLGMSEMGIVP